MAVMRERQVRHLPVVDDAGKLLGIVTDRDLRSAAFAPAIGEYLSVSGRRRLRGVSEGLENLRVRDAMTWDCVTIAPDALVAQAAALMFEGRFGSLPVVEGGDLRGIVTERDVLRVLARAQAPARGIDPDSYFW